MIIIIIAVGRENMGRWKATNVHVYAIHGSPISNERFRLRIITDKIILYTRCKICGYCRWIKKKQRYDNTFQ